MQPITNLFQLKYCHDTIANRKYIIALSGCLWVFSTDYSLLYKVPAIKSPRKAVFISEDEVLYEDRGNKRYGILSIPSREIIWSTKIFSDYMMSSRRFALSRDKTFAYDFFDSKGIWHFVRINLPELDATVYPLYGGFSLTSDICCGEEVGTVYLLQTQVVTVAGQPLRQSGIVIIDPGIEVSASTWLWQEQKADRNAPRVFLEEYILYDDLHCFCPKTGESFQIAGLEPGALPDRAGPLGVSLSNDGQYLTLIYIDRTIVTDLHTNKRVAQYRTDYPVGGRVVGDTYLLGMEDGVAAKPFPLEEEVPPWKPITLEQAFPRRDRDRW